MKYWKLFALLVLVCQLATEAYAQNSESWIRINQLGYGPASVKVAVYASIKSSRVTEFSVIDASSGKRVYNGRAGTAYGSYGPFATTYRLDFTSLQTEGTFYVETHGVRSATFAIGTKVYEGLADFALQYMRQQRSSYNPFLKDSCHTNDGYTVYGPMPDGTRVDVSGGWHDATDYLQYATTSANATYHLLAAYRDFPHSFSDRHLANGLTGTNGQADVLDEGIWGLQWLMKMHPRPDWLFNQIADDRDHAGFRLPTKDSVDYGYGKGKGRPVYFASGSPQGLGKYQNRATGAASVAGKFSSAFALGSVLLSQRDAAFSASLKTKALSAYRFGVDRPGVQQTAPNKARYFYEEDNYIDDMELAAAGMYMITQDQQYLNSGVDLAAREKVTPWMGSDTATHYQWYPFHNFGHYELAVNSAAKERKRLINYYKEGIEKVWSRARTNAFHRGIPFIWCSNNLTTSFAIQCYLYRVLSGDAKYAQLEQACFDWLFGCNPWGASMVCGMPAGVDSPDDPHSSFTVLNKYRIDGGLVDGPVNGSIYNSLLGITLIEPDEYAMFQSDLAVYHDDYGDYSTNEPTMDGTASLIYLLAARQAETSAVK